MNEIVIKNVTKRLKNKNVLDNVNLKFEGGHIYGLVGRNGSGKTMLLRAICGLISLDKGKILINGKELHKEISFPESCGVMIENNELLPNFSAYDNLKILSKIKNTATDKDIIDTIKSIGLDPKNKAKIKTYSLGMKQRLSLAQALFENPDILLLDEPTNALDDNGVNTIRDILLKEKEKGKLIIVASHNKEDITLLADIIIHVSDGTFTS